MTDRQPSPSLRFLRRAIATVGVVAAAATTAAICAPTASASEHWFTYAQVPAAVSSGATTVTLNAGDRFMISVVAPGAEGGHPSYGFEGQTGCSGLTRVDPTGVRTVNGVTCQTKKYDTFALVPAAPVGSLIGKFGTGAWVDLSKYRVADAPGPDVYFEGTAPAAGVLTLAFNDSVFSDNTGSFEVAVDAFR